MGKTIVLLILIIVMALGGLLWFDYLGVVNARSLFSPLYKAMGKEPQTSVTSTSSKPIVADLDQDRINKQLEAIEIQRQELSRREEDVAQREKLNEQIATELSNREKSQEEREKTFKQNIKKYDDKNVNIEQIAANLNGMAPQNSVSILLAMDDQVVIDVLRKVEEIAKRTGTASMGSYWLSLMPAERAAEIQRKMLSKPESLN
ncbi:MAG: flagellar protein FlbB [Spirochaetia bacterium]|nr:flagellar protein FlbB [Spirochaetia bacterium]MCI6546436.1 flagellar protein FlbB [Spirochaetia bacterium]MEE1267256.1 flagellar protein FlbB [Treponema sp.]